MVSFWCNPHCLRFMIHSVWFFLFFFICKKLISTVQLWNEIIFFLFRASKEHMTFCLLNFFFFSQEINWSFPIWMVSQSKSRVGKKNKKKTFVNTFADIFIANVFSLPLKKIDCHTSWDGNMNIFVDTFNDETKTTNNNKLEYKNSKLLKSYPDVCHHWFSSVKID